MAAQLVLEDGPSFHAEHFGARGTNSGELVFNTSLTGYQEILTDPSYRGQIVAMTQPHSGNYAATLAYFNHSYCCAAAPAQTLAATVYGFEFPSIVGEGSVYGIQFHPEKSQSIGLSLLRNFVEFC